MYDVNVKWLYLWICIIFATNNPIQKYFYYNTKSAETLLLFVLEFSSILVVT